jgi:hypothetical protein
VHLVGFTIEIYYNARSYKYIMMHGPTNILRCTVLQMYYDARSYKYIMMHGPTNILWCTVLQIYYESRSYKYIIMHGPTNILWCTVLQIYYDARSYKYITMHGPKNFKLVSKTLQLSHFRKIRSNFLKPFHTYRQNNFNRQSAGLWKHFKYEQRSTHTHTHTHRVEMDLATRGFSEIYTPMSVNSCIRHQSRMPWIVTWS